MTYLKNGIEFLDNRERVIYESIRLFNGLRARVAPNNREIAANTGISKNTVGGVTVNLEMHGYIEDVSRNAAAYHWRTTSKPARWA